MVAITILIGGVVFYRGGVTSGSKVDFNSAVGKAAPDFSLEDMHGNTIKLGSYKGKNVILFFNEGAMCYPSCWSQINMLATDKRFSNENTAAFSIVTDTKDEWQRIVSQVPNFANANILFDTAKAASEKYGVLTLPSSMHMGMMPGHSYVLIDKHGIIRYVFDDPSMGVRNDQLAAEMEKLG